MCDIGDIADGASQAAVNISNASNLLKDYINEVNKFYTGYDISKGRFISSPKELAVVHGADEFIGEISGRNLAREQINRQESAIEAERVAREKELQNQRKQAEQQDIQASQVTGAIRSASAAQSQRYLGTSTGAGPERDFMGL